MARRAPLAALLAAGLVAAGTLSALTHAANPTAPPPATPAQVESASLYCTGLTTAAGGAGGVVALLNTSNQARHATVTVVSDTGHSASTTIPLGAHASARVRPSSLVSGNLFGLSAIVDGGGVLAQVVLDDHRSITPCQSTGVTDWYASGLDTSVGSSAKISLFNPTATPAVVDVSAYTTTGFQAPAPYQGLAVGPHAEVVVNLGGQLVNATALGVRVRALRGAVAVSAVEDSAGLGSLDVGSLAPTTSAYFTRVTTASGAHAEVRLANPSPVASQVSVQVHLGSFTVPDLTASVPAYSTARLVITPNSAIPAAGLASLRVVASQPVVATLAVGGSQGLALSPAATPASALSLADLAGLGIDGATLVDTGSGSLSVSLRAFTIGSGSPAVTESARLTPGQPVDLLGLFGALHSLSSLSVTLSASRPWLVLGATTPTSPAGLSVVTLLDGR